MAKNLNIEQIPNNLARNGQWWTKQEEQQLLYYYDQYNGDYVKIGIALQRSDGSCKTKYRKLVNDIVDKEKLLSKL